MPVVNSQPIELILKGTTERVDILVTDESGVPVDVQAGGTLQLTLMDLTETVLVSDDFLTPPAGGTQIVKPAGTTGQYYFNFGSETPVKNVTTTQGDYLFHWKIAIDATSESINVVQTARVVSALTMSLIPDFRLLIDKSAKLVDDNPTDPVFLGYTDSQLISYLMGGLGIINAYPVGVLWSGLDNFPSQYFKQILFDSGLLVGVMSQELFAIDTDVDNWSDQGNTFTISHQPKLASFLNTLSQRLDKIIPLMKRQCIRDGAIRLEMGPNFRLAQLVAAAPTGALFRNVWFKG
jgi:hypothetical protein